MTSAHNLLARKRWWEESSPTALAKCLYDDLTGIQKDSQTQRDLALTFFRTYSMRQANTLRGFGRISIDQSFAKMKLNVISSVIDSSIAHIGMNTTRPYFLTKKGTQFDRDNAMALNRAMLGLFYAGNHYEVSPQVYACACIFGMGTELVQALPSGRVVYSNVLPFEQKWDPAEACTGAPRNRYIVKEVSRYELEGWAAMYGQSVKDISRAELLEHLWTDKQDKDSCSLIFAWHLASADGTPDGRFVIGTSNQVFHDSAYDREEPPMVDFHLQRPIVGWMGDSDAEALLPYQVEINYVIQKQQQLVNLATTQMWIRKGEGVGKLDNRNMGLNYFKNQPPVVLSPAPYAKEFNEWREMILQKAYQMRGYSELSAKAERPPGLTSGTAITRFKDFVGRRLQQLDMNWDRHHVKVAETTLAVCRQIAKTGGAPKHVMGMGDRYVDKIPFDKLVKTERNNYSIKPYPASMLPDTPEGQIQLATDISKMNPELGNVAISAMTNIPDIEAAVERINAPHELLKMHLDGIMRMGRQYMPNSNMDLSAARIEVERAICQAEKEEYEPDVIDKLARYQSEVDRLQLLEAPPQMPGGPAGPGGPSAAPPGMMTPGVGASAIPSPAMMMNNPTGQPPLMG